MTIAIIIFVHCFLFLFIRAFRSHLCYNDFKCYLLHTLTLGSITIVIILFFIFFIKKKKTKPILKWKKKCATNKKIREFKVKPHFYWVKKYIPLRVNYALFKDLRKCHQWFLPASVLWTLKHRLWHFKN